MDNRTFSPTDIETATRGFVNRRMLHDWHRRERKHWLTPTVPGMPGKAHVYSEANFIEAVLVGALLRCGYTNDSARGVIKHRLRVACAKSDGYESTGYESRWAEKLSDLPEIQKASGYWIIVGESSDDKWGHVAQGVIFCSKAKEIAGEIDGLQFASILDVGAVIKDAITSLNEA